MVSSVLPEPLVVQLTDPYDNILAGALVEWSFTSGGATSSAGAGGSAPSAPLGASSSSQYSSDQGLAETYWWLGAEAGLHTATVTARGNVVATFNAQAQPGPLDRIMIAPAHATLRLHESSGLSAILEDKYGNEVGGQVTWTTTDPETVAVDQSGNVTALAHGSAVVHAAVDLTSVTATAARAPTGQLVGSAVVTVPLTPPAALRRWAGDDQTGVAGEGLGAPLIVSVEDAAGSGVPGIAVGWTVTEGGGSLSATSTLSDASGLATVDWTLGSVAGTNRVRAFASGLPFSSFVATGTSGPLAQILVSPSTLQLESGNTHLLSGTPADANGNPVLGHTVSWSTSDDQVITIDGSGMLTAVGPGTATVTATAAGATGSASVNVASPSESLAQVYVVPNAVSLNPGQTQAFTASGLMSDGSTTSITVNWSATGGAINGSGLYTAESAPGTYQVTATEPVTGTSGTASVTITSSTPTPVHTGFYVSPSGSWQGDGSAENPWDLATALAQPMVVQPLDTLWLRGGTYLGSFTSELFGAPGSPVVLRQYPGERAVIDGSLEVKGRDAWYWGFEVMNSNPDRMNPRPTGINVFGPDTKFINLIVHDAGNGIGFWSPATNSEIYGSIIYNNGWEEPDRGHGHGIYTQNALPSVKRIEHNAIAQNFGFSFHAYTQGGSIQGWDIRENVSLGSFLIGGRQPVDEADVVGNHRPGGPLRMGYSPSVSNVRATLRDNVESQATTLRGVWSDYSETGTLDGDTLNTVFVYGNRYEDERALVVIYNAAGAPSVTVDLSELPLTTGGDYRLLNIQDPLGQSYDFTYTGGAVSVPMTGWTGATPIGYSQALSSGGSVNIRSFLLVGM